MSRLTAGLIIGTRSLSAELRLALEGMSVPVVLEQTEFANAGSLIAKVDEARAAVLFIEPAVLGASMGTVLRELKASAAAPALVAVHQNADPDLILSTVRAGAGEFLYPPFETRLRAALARIASERDEQAADGASGGKTLAFFSAKGGCGATSVLCHVAVELQRQTQNKILVADLDVETGLVRFYLKSKSNYSVLDAANNIERLDFNFWRALISNGMPRLEIISAPTLSPAAELPEQEAFRHVIRFARSQYDWVLVDLGRSLTGLSMRVLEEIDESFVVVTLDVPALYQAKHILRTLLDTGYGRNRLRVILNRMPKRSEVTLGEVEQMLGVPVYGVLPDDQSALYEAYAEGKLVSTRSALGEHLARLTARIAGIPEKKKSKFSFLG